MTASNIGPRRNDANVPLVREWLAWLRSMERSDGTVRLYRKIVQSYVDDCVDGRPLDSVTAEQIEKWLQRPRGGRAQGMVAMPATQARDASCVRSFYGWLAARGHVVGNPMALVATPTIRNRQPRPIVDEVWLRLWTDAVGAADRATLGLGFFCGLRREEITQLRASHVDLGGRRLVNFVRKGGGEDVLPVGTMLEVFERRLPHVGASAFWPILEGHVREKAGGEFLVGWADLGTPQRTAAAQRREPGQLAPEHVNHWLHRLSVRQQVPHLHPHMLRHSCATNLLRAGVPLAIVSNLLNHGSVTTTMRYLKAGGDELGEWLARGR